MLAEPPGLIDSLAAVFFAWHVNSYTGMVLPRSETEGDSKYIYKLDGVKLDINAERFGNEFRFCNAPEVKKTKVGTAR